MVISAQFVLKFGNTYLDRRNIVMENQIWEKVALFLKELRCEDIKRSSIIHLDSCENEKEYLKELKEIYDKEIARLSEKHKKSISDYMEQLQVISFEEQQEAYCQGIIDCIQMLFGLGVLTEDKKIMQAIEKIK